VNLQNSAADPVFSGPSDTQWSIPFPKPDPVLPEEAKEKARKLLSKFMHEKSKGTVSTGGVDTSSDNQPSPRNKTPESPTSGAQNNLESSVTASEPHNEVQQSLPPFLTDGTISTRKSATPEPNVCGFGKPPCGDPNCNVCAVIENFKARDNETRKENFELRKQYGNLTQKNGDLTQENGELKQENGELKQENGELKKEKGELKQENSEFKQEISELKQEISELKQEISELKARLREVELSGYLF
jgi:DNA repair exonuclease SbcCD ATPase subunit